MSQPKTVEEIARSLVGAGRPIIKRPRLTRLLDEAETRVIMLVAPAGYGKTTLAHEWLDGRNAPNAWYTCSPASADVAALAAGIGDATEVVVPGASERIRTRLRVTNAPESEVDVLAELLAEDLAAWPDEAWLCLDDYHFTNRSGAAEGLVDRLVALAPIRLLIATRERAAWATPRRILYGELTEIGMNALALTHDEAEQVLTNVGPSRPGLLALADGWPAAIGLAAVTPSLELPQDQLPRTLYDYIADELFHTADPTLQRQLAQLAVAPNATTDLVNHLFDSGAQRMLHDAVRSGFLTLRGDDRLGLHPLLRTFLEGKLREQGSHVVSTVVSRVGEYLLARALWDDAFLVASKYEEPRLLHDLIAASLETALAHGRLSTLNDWLSHPLAVDAPMIDLATAELAFREADYAKAQTFASRAAGRAPEEPELRAKALTLAGNAAYFRERREDALHLFREAKSLGSSDSARLGAVAGELKTHLELESAGIETSFRELTTLQVETVEEALTVENLKLFTGLRTGRAAETLSAAEDVMPLLAKSRDPLVRTSFLNVIGEALVLASRYSKALATSNMELEDAETYKLSFVRPHALAVKAAAELGLRDFRSALRSLQLLDAIALEQDDVHSQMAARAIRVRVRVAQGAFEAAQREMDTTWDRLPSRGMHGEYLASIALAYACSGETSQALSLCAQAESRTKHREARTLSTCARAIVAVMDGSSLEETMSDLVEALTTTHNYDALVTAYRGHPPLLRHLAAGLGDRLTIILHEARDRDIAAGIGVEVAGPPPSHDGPPLTRREREVYDLMLQGLRNREIAKMLFITESTAKVHVRNILHKLGVRSRTEAVARRSTG